MVNLSINCGGIKSPNPFWLASGPPTNSAYRVCKAGGDCIDGGKEVVNTAYDGKIAAHGTHKYLASAEVRNA